MFVAAGLYNIAWGLYSALDPQWLFRFAEMPPGNYPQIFACLGMVVGLYGVLYLEVARVPERGALIAAVGLTGKTLGPLGLAPLICERRVAACHGAAVSHQRSDLVDPLRVVPLRLAEHAAREP